MNKVILIKLPGTEGKDIDGATDFIQSLLDQANQAEGANKLEESPQMEMDFDVGEASDNVEVLIPTSLQPESDVMREYVPRRVADYIVALERVIDGLQNAQESTPVREMTIGEMIEFLRRKPGISMRIEGGMFS